MCSQLIVVFAVIPFDGDFLDRAVHSFDLPLAQGWLGLVRRCSIPLASQIMREAHRLGMDGGPVAGLLGELEAIVGENGADRAGHGFERVLQGLPGGAPVGLFNALGHGKFVRAVESDEEMELTIGPLHVCDINVKELNWIALELLASWLVPCNIRQARNAIPLRANKSETYWWLKFKLEGAGEPTHGYALTGAAFGGCGVWRDATDRAPCPWRHRPFGADGRADGCAEAAEFHGEIQAAYS
jgi:hypothetical protein